MKNSRILSSAKRFFRGSTYYKLIVMIQVFYACCNGLNLSIMSKRFFNKGFSQQVIYLGIPIIFETIIFEIMVIENVFIDSVEIPYIKDVSNSVCLTILFLIAYYLPGYYFNKVDNLLTRNVEKKQSVVIKKTKSEVFAKKHMLLQLTIKIIALAIACLAIYVFVGNAYTEGKYWMNRLHLPGIILYGLFLGVVWYQSVLLLAMVMISGFIIYSLLKENLITYDISKFNMNNSIMGIFDILICNFSYGLLYIVGGVVFIINDTNNKSGTFKEPFPSILLLMIMLMLTLFALVPLQELFSYMKKRKTEYLKYLDFVKKNAISTIERISVSKKIIEVERGGTIIVSPMNVLVVISSIVLPLLGLIVDAWKIFQ